MGERQGGRPGRSRGKRLHPIRRYVSLLINGGGGGSDLMPTGRQFFLARFWATIPQARELNVGGWGRFSSPTSEKNFTAGMYAATSCGGIGTNGASGSATVEKGPFCGGSGQGRACGRAPRARGSAGANSRTCKAAWPPKPGEGGGRLRRSAGLRQIPTLRSPPALLAARDLATPALAGGHWRKYLEKICTPPPPVP